MYRLVPVTLRGRAHTGSDQASNCMRKLFGNVGNSSYEPTFMVPLSVAVMLPGGGGGAALRAVPTIVMVALAYCDITVKLLAGPAAH